MRSADKRLIRKSLLMQGIVSVLLAGVLAPFGVVMAYSGLLGGTVATAANGVFAYWVFRPYRAQQAGVLVSRFYGAEIAKMAIIVLAFAGAFLWVEPLSAAALFGCFIVVHLVPVAVAARG